MRLIGQRLMVHPTSVTNTIDRLEKQGHVVRKPNPEDGRGTLAEITATGREVVAAATADLMAAEFGMGGYSDEPAGGHLGHAAPPAGRGGRLHDSTRPRPRGLRQRQRPARASGRRQPEIGAAVQVWPPSVVTNTSPRLASAGTATPWVALVIPT